MGRVLGLMLMLVANNAMAEKIYSPESANEIHSASGDVINCGKVNASKLDDGVSDALTIATAVALSCKNDIDILTNALIKADFGEALDQQMHDSLLQKKSKLLSKPENFLEIVLKSRTKNKK